MALTDNVAGNMRRLLEEYDISARGLAERANMPQKTVWNMLTSKHSCRLDNLEQVCKTLFVSPAAMITPGLPLNVLMSRRMTKFIDKYAEMTIDEREKVEKYMDSLTEQQESPA